MSSVPPPKDIFSYLTDSSVVQHGYVRGHPNVFSSGHTKNNVHDVDLESELKNIPTTRCKCVECHRKDAVARKK
jgi:hypothetical protein